MIRFVSIFDEIAAFSDICCRFFSFYYQGRRSAKGSYRGRGRGRGADRGYARVNRPKGFGNQNGAPKEVRGRGPRRYHPSMKNKSDALPSQNKQ